MISRGYIYFIDPAKIEVITVNQDWTQALDASIKLLQDNSDDIDYVQFSTSERNTVTVWLCEYNRTGKFELSEGQFLYGGMKDAQ